MLDQDQNTRNEYLRHITLEVLATRHPAALPLSAIRRRAAQSADWKLDDSALLSALEFLVGTGLAATQFDELGSTRYWLATSLGVRTYERI